MHPLSYHECLDGPHYPTFPSLGHLAAADATEKEGGCDVCICSGVFVCGTSRTVSFRPITTVVFYNIHLLPTDINHSALASSIVRAVFYTLKYISEDQTYYMGPISCWA